MKKKPIGRQKNDMLNPAPSDRQLSFTKEEDFAISQLVAVRKFIKARVKRILAEIKEEETKRSGRRRSYQTEIIPGVRENPLTPRILKQIKRLVKEISKEVEKEVEK